MQLASDFTNERRMNSTANLRAEEVKVRRQVLRGMLDIETIEGANAKLVATMSRSLQTATRQCVRPLHGDIGGH